MLIRHLLLPGALGASLRAVERLYGRYGDDVILSLMSQYTPMGDDPRFPMLSRRVPQRHYEALVDHAADLGVTRCYVQEKASADASFIPPFDGEGITAGGEGGKTRCGTGKIPISTDCKPESGML